MLAGICKKYLWAFQESKPKGFKLREGKLSHKDTNNPEMEQVYRYYTLRKCGVKQKSCTTVSLWLLLWPVERMQYKKQQKFPRTPLKYSFIRQLKKISFSAFTSYVTFCQVPRHPFDFFPQWWYCLKNFKELMKFNTSFLLE